MFQLNRRIIRHSIELSLRPKYLSFVSRGESLQYRDQYIFMIYQLFVVHWSLWPNNDTKTHYILGNHWNAQAAAKCEHFFLISTYIVLGKYNGSVLKWRSWQLIYSNQFVWQSPTSNRQLGDLSGVWIHCFPAMELWFKLHNIGLEFLLFKIGIQSAIMRRWLKWMENIR